MNKISTTESNEPLDETNCNLRHSLQAKDLFVANLSHELRTPLASILGFSDSLLMGLHGALSDEQARHVTTIQRNSEHLLSLIDDLLDLSRIGAGMLELREESVSCTALIEDVRAVAEPLAARKKLKLSTDLIGGEVMIHADLRALRQILFNLVSNAIKFTDQGSVSITCSRREEPAGTRLLFEVRDTGPGISPEDSSRLFRPFSQLRTGEPAGVRGSGLGLNLSLKLAEQMNGEIRVSGTPGVGSLFTLALPFGAAGSSSA